MKILSLSLCLFISSVCHAGRFGYKVPSEASSLETIRREAQNQDPRTLYRAITWNIFKGGRDSLGPEYTALAKGSDFVLLQEATNHLKDIICLEYSDCFFSTAFQYKETSYGVATISKHPTLEAISLQSDEVEPILLTPKSSIISSHLINGSPITIVNTHGINFVGLTAFEVQMREISEYLSKARGPIIWAGDFNTWNNQRLRILEEITGLYDMDEVIFDNNDCIKSFMGLKLDRVFAWGIKVESAKCMKRDGSDHNPLILDFQTLP